MATSFLSELDQGQNGSGLQGQKHEKLKRIVALKMVSIHPRDGSQDLEQFQAEAVAADPSASPQYRPDLRGR